MNGTIDNWDFRDRPYVLSENGYPMYGMHAVYWLKMVYAQHVDTEAYFVFVIQAGDINYH